MKILLTIQKCFALPLAICLGLTAQAQTVFFSEDFETDGQGSRYTASTPFNDGSSDHWNRTDGSDISNNTAAYSSFSGTFFWAAEDTDDDGGNGEDDQTLDITGIDITGKTGLQLQALFGAGNEDGVKASSYDSTDYIKVQAQIDGGGYNEVLWFSYLPPGGDYSNEPFGVDRDFDGAADSAEDLLGTALQSYSADISGTGSTLDIRIQVHMDIAKEEIAFDDIQLLEFISSEEAITLSASPTTVDEGSTLAVTLTVPTSVSTDTTFNLTSGSDGSELSIPATVTILSGTSSIDFDVSGLSDGEFDGNQDVTITAALAGYISDSIDITVVDAESATPSGDLIISQYYEGSSDNKYIEVTNIGDNPIDLTGYTIVRWGNERAEEYKTAEALPADNADSLDLSSLGIIQPDQTMVFANSGADSPLAGSSADLSGGYPGPFVFTGNDSIVIYNSAIPNPANIVDAIGFTFTGEEGKDTGFVRAGAFQGYDLIAGSNASSSQFGTVWTEITNTTADAASYGDDGFIGTTALATAPTAINFTDLTIMVAEDGVSADLTVEISNPDGANTVSVDVVFNSESSTADTADISDYTTQTLTFPSTAVTGEQQTVTVTITDDSDLEGIEEAIFDLSNLVTSNANAQIGGADTATLTIQDNDAVIPDLIISEVADPNGTAGTSARYVELYNPTDSTIDLAAGNWSLVRYLTTASATKESVSLTGSIPAGGTYVVARSESVFTSTYGQSPDQSNGYINGNGDDAYALFFGGNNITGTLVDLYGDIGDGSGGIDGRSTDWEYEDGRALRNSDITSPNATFNASEWTIYNDSASVNGTAEVADMTPGVHPDPSAADPVAEYLTVRGLLSDDLGTDTNGNGFTVLEEYLAGFGDSSGSDVISYGIDNDGTLALTLTSDSQSEPSGITVVLQATSDLGVDFAPVAFTASVGDVNDDGTYTHSYTETTPPAGEQRFLRLSITEE
jgi:hypothetical protein